MHAAQRIHKPFISGYKGLTQKIILTYQYSKGDTVLSAEKNNKLKAHCNKLITYISDFCNVVLEFDFLSYCSTDEYPEELDRLIRFNNAIQVSIARFLTFNLCEQGLTIHSSFQFPRMRRSIQRQNLPTTKANVLCQRSWFS